MCTFYQVTADREDTASISTALSRQYPYTTAYQSIDGKQSQLTGNVMQRVVVPSWMQSVSNNEVVGQLLTVLDHVHY